MQNHLDNRLDNRLLNIIESAKSCNYYKKYDLSNIMTLRDLKFLPIINKEVVRRNLDDFINTTVNKSTLIEDFTSGSTGIPLTCYRTKMEQIQLSFILNSERKKFNNQVNQKKKVEFGSFSKRSFVNTHINSSTLVLSSL